METPSPPRPSPTRSWSDLPQDLLSQIADRLEIMELLNFRGTCRDFRWASSSASAKIESMPDREPWLLIFGENKKCRLCDQTDQEKRTKRYTGNIPELEGATCLASHEGWLLLFKEESIFFFCPFSSAKIPLPSFPHSDVKDHVATLSSPPTSEDCVISVINRHNETTILELNVIQRGAATWTKHEFHCREDFGNVTGAIYDDGTFYYVDNVKSMITFDLEDSCWASYWLVKPTASDSKTSTVPFSANRCYVTEKKVSTTWDDFENDVSVSVCGTLVRRSGVTYKHLIHNQQLDVGSNCSEREGNSEKRRLQGVWIQPRFFQLSADQSWLM